MVQSVWKAVDNQASVIWLMGSVLIDLDCGSMNTRKVFSAESYRVLLPSDFRTHLK